MEEVLVLAYQNQLALGCVMPDFGIGRLPETHIQHVLALAPGVAQKTRQSGRELVVYGESHEASRTGWSVW